MARLVIKSPGFDGRVFELKLGANRVGRSPSADFIIVHPTVSGMHCELQLINGGVIIRDLESTNGTFVNGKRIQEAALTTGQTLLLGDVELFVENADVTVAIPKFTDPELAAPPVVLDDGSMICPRHPGARVTHRCMQCKEVMCDACVHRLRRKGSKTILLLCPICSSALEQVGTVAKKKKKSLFARVGETVRLKFTAKIPQNPGDEQ